MILYSTHFQSRFCNSFLLVHKRMTFAGFITAASDFSEFIHFKKVNIFIFKKMYFIFIFYVSLNFKMLVAFTFHCLQLLLHGLLPCIKQTLIEEKHIKTEITKYITLMLKCLKLAEMTFHFICSYCLLH